MPRQRPNLLYGDAYTRQENDPEVVRTTACTWKYCRKPVGEWCRSSAGKLVAGLHAIRRRTYSERP